MLLDSFTLALPFAFFFETFFGGGEMGCFFPGALGASLGFAPPAEEGRFGFTPPAGTGLRTLDISAEIVLMTFKPSLETVLLTCLLALLGASLESGDS